MKILDNSRVAWIITAVLAVISLKLLMSNDDTVTRSFCAYNKVFVEFEEGGKKWGTLMLDWSGHPIPCVEDSLPLLEKQGNKYDKSV